MDPRPTEQDPFVGRNLGPSYAVTRRIGAGGMGAVYEAKHRQTGRRVAIKVLNRDMAQDPALLERFRREAKITAALETPHVVKVLEFDQLPDGVPYMVMEYLEGEDLEARLKRVKKMGVGEALELLRGASAALTEAHAAGVIHRDIKPGNLFYAREGTVERVKLLDFGISKASNLTGDGLTVFGQVLGTVWYMSPEQARGGEMSAASDVYALAVVLYEALSGALPYEASSPMEYLMLIQTGTPRRLIEHCPELPLGLDAVFERAMAREPALRTPDVAAFAREVEDTFTMGSEQTTVRRASSPGLRAPPPPPPPPPKGRVVTAGKMPALRVPETTLPTPGPRTASDPRLRAAPPRPLAPPVEDEFGSTMVARHNTPPTPNEALRHAIEPTTLDEDEKASMAALDAATLNDSTRVVSAPAPLPASASVLEPEPPTKVGGANRPSRGPPLPAPAEDEGSTRVVAAPPRRPDTAPTPPADDLQGPTIMNMQPFEPEPEPEPARRASPMRARPASRGSEEDPEAARFTPPMGIRAQATRPLPPLARPADPDPEPELQQDEEPTANGHTDDDGQPTLRGSPAPLANARNGHVVALGIALGLGLLLVIAAIGFFATHH